MIHILDRHPTTNTHGTIQIITKNKHGQTIKTHTQTNTLKTHLKETLTHQIQPNNLWNPNANNGTGAWQPNTTKLDRTTPRYIILGASYDTNGNPIQNDPRYYTTNNQNQTTPIKITPGNTHPNLLINPIPINTPNRPLKKIQNIYLTNTYQPAGTPTLQTDTQALNTTITFETTLQTEEYNGITGIGQDHFTITEIGIATGPEEYTTNPTEAVCEKLPHELFQNTYNVNLTGTATVVIDTTTDTTTLHQGDQVQITDPTGTTQLNNYYLIIHKTPGGHDITLDRIPTDTNGNPITGATTLIQNNMQIIAHRILTYPQTKNINTELTIRWSLHIA